MRLVAPNELNTVELIQPLLLMRSRTSAEAFRQGFGIHLVHVPSNRGGRLIIGLGRSAKPPGVVDWRSDVSLTVMDPRGNFHPLADPDESLRLDVPPGSRGNGNYYVYVHAPGKKYWLYACFVDRGHARQADGSPLIPWNFWYFPYSRSLGNDRTAWAGSKLQPLVKYEKAFENRGALAWEREFHSDLHGAREPWEGHCDDAAPASVLFEEPPAEGVTHRGVTFTCEELKFLAAEITARFKLMEEIWVLNSEHTKVGPFHDRKPNEAPREFGEIGDGGILLLLGALQLQIREAGAALLMDLRDPSGTAAGETWNHAVFMYETWYWQTSVSDLGLVELETILYANGDTMRDDFQSSGLPADVVGTGANAFVRVNDTAVKRHLRFRVRFTAGHFDEESGDRLWRGVTDGAGTPLHAPRYAAVAQGLPPEPNGSPPHASNPRVVREDVLELMRLRGST